MNPMPICRLLRLSCAAILAFAVVSAPSAQTSVQGISPEVLDTVLKTSPASQPAASGVTPTPPPREPLVVVSPAPQGKVFGSQLFGGTFRGTLNPGFNPDYVLTVGDRVLIRLWGGVNYEGAFSIDAQGNVFLPNLGPIALAGVRNGDLNEVVERAARTVYRNIIGVYATLDVSQPVKVFVTGSVRQPGLYSGLASDSVLSYLDKAGGVDQDRGSYVDIQIKRGQNVRKQINLYDFLLEGRLDLVQFQDGDVVVVGPRANSFTIDGEVYNGYEFEFAEPAIPLKNVLTFAQAKPGATHVSVVRRQGSERRSEYFSIDQIESVTIQNGDAVHVTADRYPGTIQVRVDGAHSGQHAIVLPYGSTLADVLKQVKPNAMTNIDGLQLYRRSVQTRQKEMLEVTLRKIEEAALSARSATAEEATLRGKEAELLLRFVERARTIQPKGQIVLDESAKAGTLMEDGDTVIIPEKTSLVMVHGEVLFPNAVSWNSPLKAEDYIQKVGGFTQSADTSKVVLLRQNGAAQIDASDLPVLAGDEIMVLPKIETKNYEITRTLTQILYQLAVTSRVIFGL